MKAEAGSFLVLGQSAKMHKSSPKQPDHLSDNVRTLLKQMHDDPTQAAELFQKGRGQHKEELNFEGARFELLNLSGSVFERLKLNGAEFHHCALSNARFHSAELEGAKFHNCDLCQTHFQQAGLANANFSAVRFNQLTEFQNPGSIVGCTMERYELACLGPEHGGLTEGNLMDMKIVDHVADLRLRFSGIWAWIHGLSIVVFFFPYVWFLITQWTDAKFAENNPSITLLEALGRFIWNGGRNWQSGWDLDFWALARFVLVLIYQIVRFALLARTKTLEMEQNVKGLPAKFSLDQPLKGWTIPVLNWHIGRGFRWRWALRFVTIFIYVTILLALSNTYHFLQMRVPINAPN